MRAADWLIDMGPGAGEHGGERRRRGHAGARSRARGRRSPARTCRAAGASRCPCGAAASRRVAAGARRAPAQPARHRRRDPGRPVRGGHRRVGLGQVDARQRGDPAGAAEPAPPRPRSSRARTAASRASRRSTRSSTSTSRRSAARRARTRPRTPGCSTTSASCTPRRPTPRCAATSPGRFSFNVKGGRCETCQGDGTIKIEMHFLPDVYVPCEVCKGKRYNRETLEVRFKGKSIADVLEMSVEEALEFFAKIPKLRRRLQTLHDVGLDYVRLGQPATTLSGGEAQRVKLATELQKVATGRTLYVLDEPTTGLHLADVEKLLEVLQRLVDERQHGARDRAQPRRHQAGRLGRRPRARGRRRRRRGRSRRARPRTSCSCPSRTPAGSCVRCSRPRARSRPPRSSSSSSSGR